jgi:hypothetical protein
MNTKFADRIFRALFIFVFITGMVWMPNTRAKAQSPCPLSIVSYWKADGDAIDSISGNNGTLIGATYSAGIVGQSFATDVNKYIEVPDSPNLKIPQNITIEAWVNPSISTGDRVILSKGDSTIGDGWHMMLRQNNTLAVQARFGGAWEILETSATIPVGTWHHVAYTYNGSEVKLYVDGVLNASRMLTGPIQQNTRPLKIGTVYQNYAFFVGLIDEVAIYNNILSESELNGHYENGMAGESYCEWIPEPPSFLVWRDRFGITGSGWPANVEVQVTADNPETMEKPDIELTLTTNTKGMFEGANLFPGLQPGWLITVTYGMTTKTHIVKDISITDADPTTDIVRGTAYPGTEVWVNVVGNASGDGLFATADSSGEWVADFLSRYDITSGGEVVVLQEDEDGDGTIFSYPIPYPGIQISPGTSLTTPSRGTQTSGTPTVFWEEPLTVRTTGCSGGTGTATLMMSEGYVLQTITLNETSPTSGIYEGTFAVPYPHHGMASISFAIHFPDCDDTQLSFTLYIDPSGVVRDTFGYPVVGATVTLYRSVDPGGPFVELSDGSAIMSPGNRMNPDLTGAYGLFGWDVVAGYYKVRAEKAGCSAPGGSAFAETGVLTIPPPATDLELILKCPSLPIIIPVVSGSEGNNGWYISDVTVSWDVSEPETGIVSSDGCNTITLTADTMGKTLTCSATSGAGLTNSVSITIPIDKTAPAITWTGDIKNGNSFYFGYVPSAPTCTASDGTSGLDGSCNVSGYGSTVGSHTLVATAIDKAGNQKTEARNYTVLAWTLKGFYQPVDMNNVFNIVNKGSTVPFKFEIFAGSIELTDTNTIIGLTNTPISCVASVPTDDIETTSTGGTRLQYDTKAGQFVYNWKMPNASGKCYRVTMTTIDGSSLVAYFKLK